MPKTRKPYPPEFRDQMVALVRAGRTPEELSREFEPTAQSIINWVAQADRDEGKRKDGLTSAEREELRRLRKATERLVLSVEHHRNVGLMPELPADDEPRLPILRPPIVG